MFTDKSGKGITDYIEEKLKKEGNVPINVKSIED